MVGLWSVLCSHTGLVVWRGRDGQLCVNVPCGCCLASPGRRPLPAEGEPAPLPAEFLALLDGGGQPLALGLWEKESQARRQQGGHSEDVERGRGGAPAQLTAWWGGVV